MSVGLDDHAVLAASRSRFADAWTSYRGYKIKVFVVDLVMIVAASTIAVSISRQGEYTDTHFTSMQLVVILSASWLAALAINRANDRRYVDHLAGIRRVILAGLLYVAVVGTAMYLAGLHGRHLPALYAAAAGTALLVAGRAANLSTLVRQRRIGLGRIHALVVGRQSNAHVRALMDSDRYRVERIIDLREVTNGRGQQLVDLVADRDADAVIITDHNAFGDDDVRPLLWHLERKRTDLFLAEPAYGVPAKRATVEQLGQLSLLRIGYSNVAWLPLMLKRLLDIVVSGLAIIALSPLFLAVAIAIKLEDGGKVFFIQHRVGRNGRLFPFFKLRSMRPNAHLERAVILGEADEGILDRYREDNRITRVGAFTRRWSIDELPQLFNVLRGDMSLVGPRPLLEEELPALPARGDRRHDVTPGLTGLWQVSGRKELMWEERIELDLNYVDGWSLTLDARILARTVGVVVKGTGAY